MNDRDLDAEFERIISRWDEQAVDPQSGQAIAPAEAGPVTPEPESGDPSETGDIGASSPSGIPEATPPGLSLTIAPMASHAWRGAPPPAEDVDAVLDSVDDDTYQEDDHFEPPTLDDLPKAEDDPMFWAIVVGLGGGPLLLLYLLIFDRDGSGWWVATALAMTVVGFVLLVLRGGTERDPFDDGTRV